MLSKHHAYFTELKDDPAIYATLSLIFTHLRRAKQSISTAWRNSKKAKEDFIFWAKLQLAKEALNFKSPKEALANLYLAQKNPKVPHSPTNSIFIAKNTTFQRGAIPRKEQLKIQAQRADCLRQFRAMIDPDYKAFRQTQLRKTNQEHLNRTRIAKGLPPRDIKPKVEIPLLKLKSRANLRRRLKKLQGSPTLSPKGAKLATLRLRNLANKERAIRKENNIRTFRKAQSDYNAKYIARTRKMGEKRKTLFECYTLINPITAFNSILNHPHKPIKTAQSFAKSQFYYDNDSPPIYLLHYLAPFLCPCKKSLLRIDWLNNALNPTQCPHCGFTFKPFAKVGTERHRLITKAHPLRLKEYTRLRETPTHKGLYRREILANYEGASYEQKRKIEQTEATRIAKIKAQEAQTKQKAPTREEMQSALEAFLAKGGKIIDCDEIIAKREAEIESRPVPLSQPRKVGYTFKKIKRKSKICDIV